MIGGAASDDPSRPSAVPRRPPTVRSWEGMRRVLAVRLDAAGDVLMTTPAIRALRTTADHLALLTSRSGAAAAALVPELDEVLVYDAPWMKPTPGPDPAGRDAAMIDRLRAERYDGAAIFTVNTQSPLPAATFLHLAGVPRRLAHCRENPYQLLTDWVPDPEVDGPIRHEVRRQLDLVAAVGLAPADDHLFVHVPDTGSRSVRELLGQVGVAPGTRWLAVHAGATAPSRRYPPDQLGRAVRELCVRTGWVPVYTGDTGEASLVEDVRAAAGGIGVPLAGRLSFSELAALIALAPMLITNNTAPAHLAAAVGTPVVDLYALTNLQHTPWQVPSRVLSVDVPCKGCLRSVCPLGHNRCLRAIEPSEIVAAALDLAREAGVPLRDKAGPESLAARGQAVHV